MVEAEQANFEKLRVYQQALDLTEVVYRLTRKFPREELFGVTSQLNRAVVSVPLNIAEGQGRWTRAENKNFLIIARGSLYEILAIVEVASRQKYISVEDKITTRQRVFSLIRQINQFISYLKK